MNKLTYNSDPDGDPRVPVEVFFKDGITVEGTLDNALFPGGSHFEIADRGVRTCYRWDDVDRIEVVRP